MQNQQTTRLNALGKANKSVDEFHERDGKIDSRGIFDVFRTIAEKTLNPTKGVDDMDNENKSYSLDELLSICPSMIARESHKAEESRFLWKEAELSLKKKEAKLYLQLKAGDGDLKVEDLKNLVNESDKIYEQRLSVLSHESEYKKNMIDVDRWENLFNTARKKASLKIAELENLNFSGKQKGGYNGESEDHETVQD